MNDSTTDSVEVLPSEFVFCVLSCGADACFGGLALGVHRANDSDIPPLARYRRSPYSAEIRCWRCALSIGPLIPAGRCGTAPDLVQ